MNNEINVSFDDFEAASKDFEQVSESVDELYYKIKTLFSDMFESDWQGSGSEKMKASINSFLPLIRQCQNKIYDFAEETRRIKNEYCDNEQRIEKEYDLLDSSNIFCSFDE